jgi:hypothetical protein
VTATNAVGTSLPSAPSNGVTPAAPAVAANVENENENEPNRVHPHPVPPVRPPLLPIINHTP